MNRAAALSLSLLISATAEAATTYRLTTTGTSGSTASRVWIDGQRYRMELDASASARTHDIVISVDGDRTATMLNLGQQTWFRREEVPVSMTSRLLRLPGVANEKMSKLTFNTHDEVSDVPFADRRTEKRVMRVSYAVTGDLYGAPLRGNISITGMFVTAPELPQAPHRTEFKSGIPQVDEAVNKFIASLPGLLVDQTLAITQVIEGARPRTETIRTVVDNYESAEPTGRRVRGNTNPLPPAGEGRAKRGVRVWIPGTSN